MHYSHTRNFRTYTEYLVGASNNGIPILVAYVGKKNWRKLRRKGDDMENEKNSKK